MSGREPDDEAWYADLFARLYTPLCRYAHAQLGKSNLGVSGGYEEIVQDAFAALWQNRARLYGHPSVRAWLYRTVYNKAVDRFRSDKVRADTADHSLDDDRVPEPDIAGNETEAQVLLKEQRRAIVEAIGQENYLFLLDYFDKTVSRDELAGRFGISKASLRSRAHRIIAPLRNSHLSIFLALLRCV